MADLKWPALAIQAVLLAANIAYLLAGQNSAFIIGSITILMFLFLIQSVSINPRFLYLFPIDPNTRISTPSWDTWILKSLIILSALLFYLGATGSYWLSFTILIVGVGFPILWDRYIEKYNRRRIERLMKG